MAGRLFTIFPLGRLLLVSIQEDIDDKSIEQLLQQLGREVQSRGARGVIIDLGNVDVVDTFLAEHLMRLAEMLHLLKAKVLISGLSAPAIMTLRDFGIELGDLEFALDTQQAMERIMEGASAGPEG